MIENLNSGNQYCLDCIACFYYNMKGYLFTIYVIICNLPVSGLEETDNYSRVKNVLLFV